MVNYLELDSVIKRYGDKLLLSDIHLSIQTNQIVGIFGRNGSGKSTLFKILFGVEDADYCFIQLNKKPIKSLFKLQNVMAYSSQDIFLPQNIYTKEILDIFYSGKLPKNIIDRFQSVFKTKVGNLSGGEQKLLQLYSVLNTESKFVILDEPFNHLSPIMIDEIKELIVEQSKTKGIIISDHSYQNVLEISNQLYLLKEGKLKKIINQFSLEEHGYLIP